MSLQVSMTSLALSHCTPFTTMFGPFKNTYITGDTKSIHPTSHSMKLASSAKWIGKGDFTKHFLKIHNLIHVMNHKAEKGYGRHRFFYSWTGSKPVTEFVPCYENERCFIQSIWHQGKWSHVTWKEWIGEATRKSNVTQGLLTSQANPLVFTHHFEGPQMQSVLFNRVRLMIRIPPLYAGRGHPALRSGRICDLEMDGAPQGIFSIATRALSQPI
ncbi:hypothetical protein DSO57_1005246 [Entomophthora muscae]|uniref:Uncharacterized protein n=1 Tax=Entomophthora muscae TaxID=34485 RepID=A0ACC2U7I5_9FUNG|nr:hypothetical protein DSO57_1005246 [Entomophthora muscae]